RADGTRPSSVGVEDERVDDRDHAPFGLRERQVHEAARDTLHDAVVRQVRPAVLSHLNAPIARDDELDRDAALQRRIAAQSVLVPHAEPTEVLAHDPLDDLGRKAAVDLRVTLARHLRGRDVLATGLVAVADSRAAGAEADPAGLAGRLDAAVSVAERVHVPE